MPDPTQGPVAAYLEHVRQDLRTPGEVATDRIREEHVPALLAVADEVVKRHRRSVLPASMGEHRGRHFCVACTASTDDQTVYEDWPCPEYEAVSRALAGEVPGA
ncbi:MAG: hypothetical protein JWO67_1769 [Streptosporangiaceae bacterium]|nr:hypothetical protein [Streptosporangiaceae bacterium]